LCLVMIFRHIKNADRKRLPGRRMLCEKSARRGATSDAPLMSGVSSDIKDWKLDLRYAPLLERCLSSLSWDQRQKGIVRNET
jgi:hypothetical protein